MSDEQIKNSGRYTDAATYKIGNGQQFGNYAADRRRNHSSRLSLSRYSDTSLPDDGKTTSSPS